MISVTNEEIKIILEIINRKAPDCDVLAFGSRYYGNHCKHSDLDLAFKNSEKLDYMRIAKIKDEFQISDLPYSVDVLDYNSVSSDFREIIDKGNEVIFKNKKNKMESVHNMNDIAYNKKKIILSGIQSSGELHIGHYFGAIKNWVNLQNDYTNYLFVANMHAITVRQDPATLRRRSLEVAATYIACGIDPELCTLFIQSHVPAHTQLSWVLNCYSMFGELSRMTQFKDKSQQHADNINAGLFTYPILMASDILLYNADLVPVGADQKQHLELSRDIAARFNSVYGDVFTIPEPYISKEKSAKIMSLQEPEKKMSKSDTNLNANILIMDKKDDIIKKFKRAVTDSETEVRFADGKDGINNLMALYSCATGKKYDEIEREFAGKGYGDFKTAAGEAVADSLAPIQKKFSDLMADKSGLEQILKSGAEKASYAANKTLAKVYKKVGFLQI